MAIQLKDVVFENGNYWVLRVKTGFEVYEAGATASRRVAIIGYHGDVGVTKAKAEIERRILQGATP